MRRVSVVGTTGSGKTNLARALAQKLGVAHIEIDALHWGPNWTPRPAAERNRDVGEALEADGWVIDGNYKSVQDYIWERADSVVWIDYSFPRTFWQLLRRTMSRWVSREILWANNREDLRTNLFTRESIFLWLLQSYWRHRREYPERQADPRWGHIQFVRLRSRRETAAWLAAVGLQAEQPAL